MPPCRTPLPQQAAPSQSQPQPCGSSHSCASSQSRSRRRCHQAAIANIPESGKEFDFTSVDHEDTPVEHEDTSPIRSNVATANSLHRLQFKPSQSICRHIKALQGMQWISTTSSLRKMRLINAASWLWDNCAAFARKSGCFSYLICPAQYFKHAGYHILSRRLLPPCGITYAAFILLYT